MKTVDLSGIWECSVPGQSGEIRLPGTLDEAGFGFPDDPARQWQAEDVKRIGFWQEGDPIVTRLTRKKVYEGPARFSRKFSWDCPAGCRVFLECERTRHLPPHRQRRIVLRGHRFFPDPGRFPVREEGNPFPDAGSRQSHPPGAGAYLLRI